MKKYNFVIWSFVLFTLCSSCATDDGVEKPVPTSVSGIVIDLERDRPYVNTKMILNSTFSCGSGFTSGACYQQVDSTFTNSQGRYSFDFNFEPNKSYYVTRDTDFITYPEGIELVLLESGASNVVDFEFWRPLVFKLNLSLRNNNNPPLQIVSRDEDDFYHDVVFPFIDIQEVDVDTTLYLLGKPNSNMRISFSYGLPPNGEYHELREYVQTARQDSLAISVHVDCDSF